MLKFVEYPVSITLSTTTPAQHHWKHLLSTSRLIAPFTTLEHADPLAKHRPTLGQEEGLTLHACLWLPSCSVTRPRKCWVHCSLASSLADRADSHENVLARERLRTSLTHVTSSAPESLADGCTAFGSSGSASSLWFVATASRMGVGGMMPTNSDETLSAMPLFSVLPVERPLRCVGNSCPHALGTRLC